MSRKVHIVGLPVRVGNHKRQLCAWCGERLVDDDLANCFSEDGSEPAHFEPNSLLEVQGVNPTSFTILKHKDGDPIPAGFCGDEGKPRLRAVSNATGAVPPKRQEEP